MIGMLLICEKAALANLEASTAIEDPGFSSANTGYFLDDTGGPTFLDTAETPNTIDYSSTINWIFTIDIAPGKPNEGSFDDASGPYGFLDTRGTVVTLNFLRAGGGTMTIGINSNGQIVGNCYDCTAARRLTARDGLAPVPEPNTFLFLAGCLATLAMIFRKLNRRPVVAPI